MSELTKPDCSLQAEVNMSTISIGYLQYTQMESKNKKEMQSLIPRMQHLNACKIIPEIVFNTIYAIKHKHLHGNNKCQLQIVVSFKEIGRGKHQEGRRRASTRYISIFFKKSGARMAQR